MAFNPQSTFTTLHSLNALHFMLEEAIRLRLMGNVRAWSDALVIMKDAEQNAKDASEKQIIKMMVLALENWQDSAPFLSISTVTTVA